MVQVKTQSGSAMDAIATIRGLVQGYLISTPVLNSLSAVLDSPGGSRLNDAENVLVDIGEVIDGYEAARPILQIIEGG